MTPQDLERFNQATQLAGSNPAQAYTMLVGLEPANLTEPNLLAWLIFTAPEYAEKERWVQKAQAVAPGDPTVQAAVNWFNQQPKPAAPAPTPPVFQPTAPMPGFSSNVPPIPPAPQQGQFQQPPSNYYPQPQQPGMPPPYSQQFMQPLQPQGQPQVVYVQGIPPHIQKAKNHLWGGMVSGAILIAASFLPWATIRNSFTGTTYSINGIDADGKITLGIGIFVGVLSLATYLSNKQKSSTRAILLAFYLLCAFLAGGVFVIDYNRAADIGFFMIALGVLSLGISSLVLLINLDPVGKYEVEQRRLWQQQNLQAGPGRGPQ